MNKELMLARQAGNTKQVALNQNTLQPKPTAAPVSDKPQLKIPGQTGLQAPPAQPQMNNFMNPQMKQPTAGAPQMRPQSMMIDNNASQNNLGMLKPPQQQLAQPQMRGMNSNPLPN